MNIRDCVVKGSLVSDRLCQQSSLRGQRLYTNPFALQKMLRKFPVPAKVMLELLRPLTYATGRLEVEYWDNEKHERGLRSIHDWLRARCIPQVQNFRRSALADESGCVAVDACAILYAAGHGPDEVNQYS